MVIQLPEKVKYIINSLQAAGYEAYAVGGCVRDCVLGREPEDWDITTSAGPEDVKKLFPRTVDTGIVHGTVTVMLQKDGFEVTTYRIDGEYEDSRHPKEVIFTADLEEDLRRRDFTINAMAYNETDGLVDIFDGIGDLKTGIIRCVGDAKERFKEDALRMLRAVRFSGQLGFSIEKSTKLAMKMLAHNLEYISAERIQAELVKLAVSPHPDYLRTAYETGLTAVILPELNAIMEMPQKNSQYRISVGEHTMRSMLVTSPDKIVRLTVLFHNFGKPFQRGADKEGKGEYGEIGRKIAKKVLNRLKFDNDTINKVTTLVKYFDYYIEETPKGVRSLASQIGRELFPLLLSVKKADAFTLGGYDKKEKLETLASLEALYEDILKKKECLSLKELAVSGQDLIEAGMQPGREMGDTLRRLLELVLESPECNTKDYLLTQI